MFTVSLGLDAKRVSEERASPCAALNENKVQMKKLEYRSDEDERKRTTLLQPSGQSEQIVYLLGCENRLLTQST